MNALRSLGKWQQLSRNISTTARRPVRDMAHLKEVQRQMQVDDGVPVYLKKGASDRVIFATVCVAVFWQTIWAAHTVKRIIFPQK